MINSPNSDSLRELIKGLLPFLRELVFVYILVFSLIAPSSDWKTEFGDGREYILQTQAIVLDRSLEINPFKRGTYFNETNPFGINLKLAPLQPLKNELKSTSSQSPHKRDKGKVEEKDQYGGGFGGLYKTLETTKHRASYYFIHSWIYSAGVAPIYVCTKFLADLLRYLGRGAILSLVGIVICSILMRLGRKLLNYANRLRTESNYFGNPLPAVNLSYEAVALTLSALVMQLCITGRANPNLLEYQAFYLANVIFFSASIVLLWSFSKTWLNLVFIAAICLSPIVPHIKWAHSEVFCFSSVILGLGLTQLDKWRMFSPIFLGLGAAQNIPIILTLPIHFILMLGGEASSELSILKRAKLLPKRLIISYLIAILLPLLIALQNYYNFGAWNLISSLNQASISNITFIRIKSVLLSPQIGALVYLPAAWLAVVLGGLSGRFKIIALSVLTSLAMVTLSSTTANINSAQLSATRYSIWTLSPMYLIPALTLFRQRVVRRWQVAIITMSLAFLVIAVGWLKTYNFIVGDLINLFSVNRARSEIAALYRWTKFHDDIEPLVENIQGAELREPYTFSRIYIWNLGENRSLWIISKRCFKKLENLGVTFKNSLLLNEDSQLAEIFKISIRENGEVTLTPKKPKKVGQRRRGGSRQNGQHPATEDINWSRNPYWGSYKMLWISGEVKAVSNREVAIVSEADGERL